MYFKKYKETTEYLSTPNNVDQFYKCIPETIVFKPILTSATFFKYEPQSGSLNQFWPVLNSTSTDNNDIKVYDKQVQINYFGIQPVYSSCLSLWNGTKIELLLKELCPTTPFASIDQNLVLSNQFLPVPYSVNMDQV